jgi:hypothetical protein
LSNKIEWGLAAQSLLENPTFQAVLDRANSEYLTRWREAKTVEAREDCHRYIKVIERISADLKSIATTGELHKKRQIELEGKKSWLTK